MINDSKIAMTLRLKSPLYLRFRDKAHENWFSHNEALELLVEKWVAGEVVISKPEARPVRRRRRG